MNEQGTLAGWAWRPYRVGELVDALAVYRVTPDTAAVGGVLVAIFIGQDRYAFAERFMERHS